MDVSLQFSTYANDKLIFILYHTYIHGVTTLLAVCVCVSENILVAPV